MDLILSKLWEMVKDGEACCSPWGHKESDMTERLNNICYRLDLISMDELENNRWFASGGYAKYHHMFANFISVRNTNNFYLPEEISTTSNM